MCVCFHCMLCVLQSYTPQSARSCATYTSFIHQHRLYHHQHRRRRRGLTPSAPVTAGPALSPTARTTRPVRRRWAAIASHYRAASLPDSRLREQKNHQQTTCSRRTGGDGEARTSSRQRPTWKMIDVFSCVSV